MGGKGGKGGQKRAVPDDAKGTRKRLSEITTELEKARVKRAKAQARVEALEALAEELAERLAADAAAASEEKGREAAQGQPTTEPDTPAAVEHGPVTAPKSRTLKPPKTPGDPKASAPKSSAPKTRKPRPTVEPA
jgi:hypothetical protein